MDWPYSPEINPAEHIWDALREDCIGNTVFASLDAADKVLSKGLRSLESDPARMQSLILIRIRSYINNPLSIAN